MTTHLCHVCGGRATHPWCPGLFECKDCTHVQADMQMSAEELADLYGYKYFHGEEYVDYELEKVALDLNFRYRLEEIRSKVPCGKSLFEIGCAYGYFLQRACECYTVAGCDISDHAITEARQSGLNVQCADYAQIPKPETPYDVVCMWDTIEHLVDPKSYVSKVFDELAPGGLFIVSTGDAGAFIPRRRREKWRMVHPPTHLHYFTAKSLSRLITDAGFSRIKVQHPPFYRNLITGLGKLKASSSSAMVSSIVGAGSKVPGLKKFNLPINLYDLMTVSAWK